MIFFLFKRKKRENQIHFICIFNPMCLFFVVSFSVSSSRMGCLSVYLCIGVRVYFAFRLLYISISFGNISWICGFLTTHICVYSILHTLHIQYTVHTDTQHNTTRNRTVTNTHILITLPCIVIVCPIFSLTFLPN